MMASPATRDQADGCFVAALIGVGAVSAVAYVFHARRTPAPILDLGLFKLETFRASILGGFVFRLGIGALPFLLPLLLQIGFNGGIAPSFPAKSRLSISVCSTSSR